MDDKERVYFTIILSKNAINDHVCHKLNGMSDDFSLETYKHFKLITGSTSQKTYEDIVKRIRYIHRSQTDGIYTPKSFTSCTPRVIDQWNA